MARRVAAGLLLLAAAVGGLFALAPGSPGGPPDLAWGVRGVRPGDFARPRAATIDGDGRLWVVDFTARVQAFDLDGNYLGITFTTPDFRNGRPSGLGTDNRGRLVVCDSHYHCVRVYGTGARTEDRGSRESPEPNPPAEVLVFPSTLGPRSSLLSYVSDCVQDADGFWYVSEFGQNDRVTKLAADGAFVARWGEPGPGPGQFNRVRALALGPDGRLYAADACNHRVQVFERDGRFVREFGGPGSGPGRFQYPYDLGFGPGGELYVVERGNARVQKLTADGTFVASWGTPGKGPGQLSDPWALAVDKLGRVHVVDTENHRVQRVRF